MKIIEGSLAGTIINYKEQRGTRVSSEKVRKAVFDVLKNLINIEGIKVADLFCGSGMYGLEAVSRGVKEVWFIDDDRQIIKALRENTNKILENIKDIRYSILDISFDKFIKTNTVKFDLVFADPPYYDFDFEKLNDIYKILNKDGIFVLEQSKRGGIKELNGLKLFLEKKYGDTVVCFYKNGNI
jgi:16S rRNA (guanine966-N2)-methyltransferase